MVIDSTFYMVIVVFTLGLIIYGHISKLRILNLLSIGGLLFLAIQWSSEVALLVFLIGVMFFELYFTFSGRE